MKMDVLRCKTPEMVRKEIWAHVLAYDLLRMVMAVAAAESGIEPRQVSFKGANQVVTAFDPKIEAARSEGRARLLDVLLAAIAYHRVGNRPGRWEPQARKSRPKPGFRLMQPRAEARLPQNRSKYYYAGVVSRLFLVVRATAGSWGTQTVRAISSRGSAGKRVYVSKGPKNGPCYGTAVL
jgi:hypothetical protein